MLRRAHVRRNDARNFPVKILEVNLCCMTRRTGWSQVLGDSRNTNAQLGTQILVDRMAGRPWSEKALFSNGLRMFDTRANRFFLSRNISSIVQNPEAAATKRGA